ncbi:MAG: nitrite/sulfite reductase [bacterium]
MNPSHQHWKTRLASQIAAPLAEEIDIYETQIEARKHGRIDEKVFAETRLRRGAYGQRYDNGLRHDGVAQQQITYPSAELTKGPSTVWDAPGMQRIKIPFGGLTAHQLEVLADLAEEYGDGIAHVTTRQDVQIHFVHIEDTPSLMRRLAAVGITTREACGNTVRNVTACPIAGVCRDEVFDVTPYAKACAHFLLGHPDTQDFGRKFKVSFSGCAEHACALAHMHDLGAVAVTRVEGGRERRGFAVYVGGGLGAVPHQAKLLDAFVPEDELLPLAQAVARVFARLGEKKNRQRARLKFVVAKLGVDEFRRVVAEERARLVPEPAWTDFLGAVAEPYEAPLAPASTLAAEAPTPAGFDAWRATNVYAQRQPGYATVSVTLPLGDITANQLRGLADLARRHVADTIRTTVEQNIVLRWVAEGDLPQLHSGLVALGLGAPGAQSIVDVVACPGTDTCKLGIASSRGLAGELRTRLAAKSVELDSAIQDLRIKVSGCFNACGQHHVADIGFYGVSRKVGSHTVPHFQVVLGGGGHRNAESNGLAMAAIPSKRIPEVVDRLADAYLRGRLDGEPFPAFVTRTGKARIKSLLDDLARVPSHAENASFYSDWGDPREFTLGDMGVGECAGEVVSAVEFGLAASERQAFEAQIELEAGHDTAAASKAFRAMLEAAKALIQAQTADVRQDPADIVAEFRKRYYETQLFFDPYAGGKFAHYLFRAEEEGTDGVDRDEAHRRVEEAYLFIEAAHACYGRLSTTTPAPLPT